MPALALAFMLGGVLPTNATSTWDVTGNYVTRFVFGGNYDHDMVLSQDGLGNVTGNGGYPAGGVHTYAWTIDSGLVSGNNISFTAHYTASADAVMPLTTMHVIGTIADDGTMSGTWDDNYQAGSRNGTWSTISGVATAVISVGPPTNKDQCKKDGWKTFNNPIFKNQGQCVSYVQANQKAGKQILTFSATDSSYYNGLTPAAGLYGTGPISFTWDQSTGVVSGGLWEEIVPATIGTHYFNNVVSGTVVGSAVNLTFLRTVPGPYGPFNFSGTLVGGVLTGQAAGPYLFTATGTVTP